MATAEAALAELRGDPRRRRTERVVRTVLLVAAAFSIVISLGIVLSLVFEAAGFLATGPALVADGWFPRRGQFDVLTLVTGSVLVTGVAMLVAVPVGLGAAIYLAEYAKPRLRRILKPILEVLAGIPSVVLGFFALAVIGPQVVQRINPNAAEPFTMAAAGIGVGFLTVPLIASVSEDAMRAVPAALREASYGMGAKRLTTVVRVVIPAAVSGLVASFILAVSRALGETMVVAIATGASGGTLRTFDVWGPGQTMTAAMASLAIGTDQVTGATNAFQSLFFVGLLLFAITVTLNLLADLFVRRTRQRY
jgi:phosphate transport system permease protein